ncbi:TraI/MobA(P) family conjugative relaxase [Herbaspirillum sp. SJZ107]|uniref:TraI/MobA(P) family conjugative relaxase n=1 Tax=Herbaspirillum sp. SJZ107 TaxID=2572881 RepID=UPI001151598F|nr:TraI/MobA(P) family conjugative relaxase [Herbaspirillum sp. SJZ107]TQK06953.1 relaxase/mobilization nuclease-like protein [Herbaspirillum sp. SJZ107]
MIAKHIPMHIVKKSGFASLVRYLTDTQGKQERTGDVRLTNCISDDVELAMLEVLNTQAMNTRSLADKTYHLIVSFRDGEEPDASTLASIEERICDTLGFIGHQRVSVVHHDTDNRHLHIAINKIHPARYTIHEPFHAYRTLARACGTIEDEFGLRKDNHMPRKVGAENRATDMEHHVGIESLLGWIQRGCKAQMQQAQSWEQLHAVLSTNGLHLHPRANGLVITAQDGTTIKASSVGRDFSKPKLEQRFGPFQSALEKEATLKPQRRYEKKPLGLRPDTAKLYAQYRAAQAQVATTRARERERVRARKEQRIEAAMRHVRLKRAALKLAQMPRNAKKMMYRALASVLRDEISEIKRESKQEYISISQKCRRRQWSDWLRHQAGTGNADALAALRRHKPTRDVDRDGISGAAQCHPPVSGHRRDSVTKQGTIIYRVGASAVRDEGDSLRVSRGAELEAMHVALRMAHERFGKRITVTGSEGFKEQMVIAAAVANLPIVFGDPVLEQRRLKLAKPATTRENPIHNHGTRPPAPRANEEVGPINTRHIRAPNPSVPQKRKSAIDGRSRR